jgi:hypothetical protein
MITVANALAAIRWRGFEIVHGRNEDAFGVMLVGLALLGGIVWLISRSNRNAA